MESEEYKKKLDDLENQLETKNNLIKTLRDSIKLKDNQLETIKDSLKLKDEQINILENSLNTKDAKIETLEKTIKLKEDQIKSMASSSVDDSKLAEKDKEIEILNDELTKADEDLERLELENEKLRESGITFSESRIIDFTNQEITKSEIIEEMRNIIQNSISSVTIAVPKIDDLQDLYLYEVRSSVNIKISCEINPGIEEHVELLDEYESLDNISLRHFDGGDRYVINRDGEELLMAIIGKDEYNHLVFKTKDPAHIRLLNPLVMDTWLRSRKI